MLSLNFYKFSPGGNTTVFLEGICPDNKKSYYCGEAISERGVMAEQAGWVNLKKNSFEMAGGEFCINACRSFGALLDINSQNAECPRLYTAEIGKYGKIDMMVEGQCPKWLVRVDFKQKVERIGYCADMHTLVQLPGINHLLVKVPGLPLKEAVPELARGLIPQYSIDNAPAFGVTFWTQNMSGIAEILPYIQVPAINTAVLENSCGSASVALAITQKIDGPYRILQPSGEILEIDVNTYVNDVKNIRVTGFVELLAQGQIWLK